jgi:hypothetical protein
MIANCGLYDDANPPALFADGTAMNDDAPSAEATAEETL